MTVKSTTPVKEKELAPSPSESIQRSEVSMDSEEQAGHLASSPEGETEQGAGDGGRRTSPLLDVGRPEGQGMCSSFSVFQTYIFDKNESSYLLIQIEVFRRNKSHFLSNLIYSW